MIDTVVFDIGNVLAHFNWRETYESLFAGQELERISDLTVRDGALWNELDRGTLSYEEVLERATEKAPELAEKLRLAVDTIYARIEPYPYAQEWVGGLKEKGFKVYALSNYGKVPFARSLPRFPFMGLMDGAVISYQVQKLKPGREIFDILCEQYCFKPEQAVFIDDNEANAKAAAALGFHAIQFKDKAQADAALARLLG